MKKLYATLFSALFLGGAICASCTDKKDASAEEVINTIPVSYTHLTLPTT